MWPFKSKPSVNNWTPGTFEPGTYTQYRARIPEGPQKITRLTEEQSQARNVADRAKARNRVIGMRGAIGISDFSKYDSGATPAGYDEMH